MSEKRMRKLRKISGWKERREYIKDANGTIRNVDENFLVYKNLKGRKA